ncbi:MAG TPA: PilZ domain-containing protein [Nitrospinota bacterium]|nr:PilZ domain-containing protein [Nitrospinota bacterium]
MIKEQIERRRAIRTVLHSAAMDVYPIDVKHHKELRGKICDLSTLGAKFISKKQYAKDSKIFVGLLLPNLNSLVNISGKVVRCEEKSSEGYHIAVEFDEDYYQQSLIKEYIRIMKLWDNQFNIL